MQHYHLSCACGASILQLHGEPAARAICHCNACRDLYSSILLAATAWPTAQISYAGTQDALSTHQHPTLRMRRHLCRHCGELVHGSNRFDLAVIPNTRVMRAYDGTLPPELAPTMHLFYAQRAFDIADALPKYLQGWDGPLA
ncbi:GFA family protein [Dyella sp. LX-66]|uniref:GFA family protein n=1 Tax=unclassified Dyella TaxID=2634549 RepID=UPI001BDF92CC|nr:MULTISPECIES: GFA family protein [unclassified Dyella]MBT2118685.1 GFA family protein [Dyella sp. LX-1]MBT2141034.1 GFA family protein [Dyella sp. LX-66]